MANYNKMNKKFRPNLLYTLCDMMSFVLSYINENDLIYTAGKLHVLHKLQYRSNDPIFNKT